MSIGNVAAYLTQTATVMRATETTATTGAIINVWSSQSQHSGRLQPYTVTKAGGTYISADKVTVMAGYRWYSAYSTSFTEKDRLRIGSTTYRIQRIADVMSMGRLMQTELELVGHDAT